MVVSRRWEEGGWEKEEGGWEKEEGGGKKGKWRREERGENAVGDQKSKRNHVETQNKQSHVIRCLK